MTSSRPSIYLTGFGKFGSVLRNPTTAIVESLKAVEWHDLDADLELEVLEVSTIGCCEAMERMWEKAQSHPGRKYFIHLGVNQLIQHIDLETTAYNECKFNIPDERHQLLNECIDPECHENALTTSLNMSQLHHHLSSKYKCHVSTDPGRYICNYLYFKSLQYSQVRANNSTSLFIHVPEFQFINQETQIACIKEILAWCCLD